MSATAGADIRKLLIVGAGGAGREVAWLAREVLGSDVALAFAVERPWFAEPIVDGVPVVVLDDAPSDATHYVVALGDIAARRRLAAACDARGLAPATLVHPGVLRSSRVGVGAGSIVCAGTILTTNVRLGRHAYVNIGCTLSHDVVLGDFATLSPGVHLSGHVHVEDDVLIGTGANVINGTAERPIVIGRGAVVGVGACVVRPVPAGTTAKGNPAHRGR